LQRCSDKYYGLRDKAIGTLKLDNDAIRNAAQPILVKLAQADVNTLVQAQAITALGSLKASGNMNLFKQALGSQSYAVQGAALNAITRLNPADALPLAKSYEKDSQGALSQAIMAAYTTSGGDAEWAYVYQAISEMAPQTQFNAIPKFAEYVARLKNNQNALAGVNLIGDFGVKYKQYVGAQIAPILTTLKDARTKMGDTASAAAADKAITALQ
jgi:aminopeptidase N